MGKKPALKKNTGKRKQPEGNQPSGKAKKPSGKGKACKHCNKKGHPESKCWELEENAASRPPQWKSVKSGEQTETTNVVENQCPVEKAGHLRGSKKARRHALKDVTNNIFPTSTVIPKQVKNTKRSNLKKRSREESTESAQEIAADELKQESVDPMETLCPMKAMLSKNNDSDSDNESNDDEFDGYIPEFLLPFTKKKALVDFKFPELNIDKMVTWVCHVDESTKKENALYDMIIGVDLMTAIGIYVDTNDKVIRWEGNHTPLGMRGLDQETVNAIYALTQDTPVIQEAEARQSKILDADYSAVDIDDYVDGLTDLTTIEKEQLKIMLHKHPELFQGGLGALDVPPVHLELKPDAKPCHAQAYPVPQSVKATTKTEIDRLESIGVLKKSSDSDWAAPMFVQKKKTGDVRVLVDFRKLNDMILRKPFPLPKINDLLQTLAGFTYATAIDLSMGYYHIPLDESSQKLCSMVLPWAKYQWARLPMGVKCAPDIFQSIVSNLFSDLEWVRAYIDDILITSTGDYADHLEKVHVVLSRLEKAGFRANVRKCFFARTEIEYLGYWLSRKGIQPQPKKVEAILRLQAPKTARQLRHFLGMVNFYRDMWRRRSHLIAPLTQLLGKGKKFKWEKEHQEAFEEIKSVLSKETLLAFPDFSKKFHIYTDASDHQIGAVIMQEGRPIAFYSRKMTQAQQGYTVGERELLSCVETCKEFKNILLGHELVIHTDHKNILYSNLANDRIARWRLILEEYGPEFVHVAGKENVVADALSRMEADFDMESVDKESVDVKAQICACALSQLCRDESFAVTDGKDAEELVEVIMAKNSDTISEKFPLSPPLIAKAQKKDKALIKKVKQDSKQQCSTLHVEGVDLIAHENRIVVPSSLQGRIVAWNHEYLVHPGMDRQAKTMAQTLYWRGLDKDVERYVRTCHKCQLCKKTSSKKHGLLPEKVAEPAIPWNRVNLDMIGPLKCHQPNGKVLELRALTMIDPATGWFEIVDVPQINSSNCMDAFDDTWLCRYPRPEFLGYDGGSEFKAIFKEMVENYGMTPKPNTPYNPQSNGIVERVHQVLNDMLRTFELENQQLDSREPWTRFLAASAFAIRSAFHTTPLGATPAQLVHNRDMLLPLQFNYNWADIRMRRQKEMARNNKRENKSRIPHTYKVGDKVTLDKPGKIRKLSTPKMGPFTIERVYNNGTVTIRKGPVSDRVSIRRIHPYREAEN